MSGIDRYIFRQLALGTLMVGLVLTAITWLTQSVKFLEYIINRGLTVGAWLKLTMLLLPSFIGIILPTALFFVVVFIYNKLIVDRELVVVQAAGVSRLRIAGPALTTAFIVTILGYWLSLYAVPASNRAFREVQWGLRSNVSQILLQEGVFNTLTEGLTIYIRDRGRGGELFGVMVHDTRQPQKSITFMAERGIIGNGANGPRITLLNGSQQQLQQGTGDLSLLYFDSYPIELGEISAPAEDRYANNAERPTFALLATGDDSAPPRIVARMHVEAHQRLSAPLTAIGYALVALAFLLTGSFDKRGQAERIAGAVAVIIALQAAALGAMNLATRALFFVPLMYMVALLPVAIGLYMIATPKVSTPWRDAVLGIKSVFRTRYLFHGPVSEDGSRG